MLDIAWISEILWSEPLFPIPENDLERLFSNDVLESHYRLFFSWDVLSLPRNNLLCRRIIHVILDLIVTLFWFVPASGMVTVMQLENLAMFGVSKEDIQKYEYLSPYINSYVPPLILSLYCYLVIVVFDICKESKILFVFLKKNDQKYNCCFGEILTWSENLLFWVDFRSLIQKMSFWGDFRVSRTSKILSSEFQLTVHKENVIMGRFWIHICSTMEILRERIVVHNCKNIKQIGEFLYEIVSFGGGSVVRQGLQKFLFIFVVPIPERS